MPFVDSLPNFWQGVLASIVAALIVTVAGFVVRISFASVREWISGRRGAIAVLRQQLSSEHPTIRSEATLQILFSAAKWLVLAALLFAASSVVLPGSTWQIAQLLLKVCSLSCLVASLWWIYQYQRPAQAKPEDWAELLCSRRWLLVFNPPSRSKTITFLPSGAVGDGQNKNEYSWRVVAGKLELVQADGRVHSRFVFNQRTTSFLHTNDSDTASIRSQFIVPADGAANPSIERAD
jgi:hypothetical protein